MTAQDFTPWKTKIDTLSSFEKHVLIDKGTERAFSGKYVHTKEDGTYRCKVCDTPLYRSGDKFNSHCGWPSFDDAIPGAIKEVPDADGRRTEIVCANCGAHMGHIFRGEGYTAKNVRHCVNSVSLNFQKKKAQSAMLKKAYFAGGCFWGVEHYLEQVEGVKEVISGFMGGDVKDPSYEDVVYKNTGHIETVEVVYDPSKVSYETLARTFFEIHDPTTLNRQGADTGTQYRSVIYYLSDNQKKAAEAKILELQHHLSAPVVTELSAAPEFYDAEAYHQDYLTHNPSQGYCQAVVAPKVQKFMMKFRDFIK